MIAITALPTDLVRALQAAYIHVRPARNNGYLARIDRAG